MVRLLESINLFSADAIYLIVGSVGCLSCVNASFLNKYILLCLGNER